MKHIAKFLVLLLAVIFYAGCTPEEKDLFGDSSANRLTTTLQTEKSLLCAPKNGWIMEYYPSSTQLYGGYNVWASFAADGSVKVMSEIYGTGDVKTSLYSLKQSAGAVLSFDTYNEVMHYFSDPANPDGIGAAGKGMEGDFEFTIMKAKSDTILLQGKKSGSRILMVALPDTKTGADYIGNVVSVKKQYTFQSFKYVVNRDTLPVTVSYRNLTITYKSSDGSQVSIQAPFIITPTGYKFYSPLTIGNVTVSELKYQKTSTEEYFAPVNGAPAKLIPVIPPLNQQLISGNWYFAYSGLGSFGKPYWDYAKTNGLDIIGEELYYAYLGKYSTGQYGFCFGSYDGSSVYKGGLVYTYTLIANNQVKLTFASSGVGDGVWYYSNAKFNYLINPLGTSTVRTFTLTTDDLKQPTWIKLTDNANANNTIILYKNTVAWPYDK
ncbi:DUF4302 domain-containing protein [Paludibacter jiangxiensis]|uniref:DUF4302 domain-containing protein n=1 Tax=Paludibacter jiangxiensis TaxID=681398 RepID=A0A170Z5R2_9BACT|nr:DUF4302 domain-containing protein [Paludibacter jiangxiensis]GAT62350.1 hypothetical protein PJIAN_1943 [Paludibacter jiangxiensis]